MKYAILNHVRFEYPVGKVLCIGRNYYDHIKELANEKPDAPVLFIKPASSIVEDGGTVVIPPYSYDCHHEVELALLIGKDCKNILPSQVMDHLAGFGVAIDLTLRDVQSKQKSKGLPWEIAKGFDTSCPLSPFVSVSRVKDPQNLNMKLMVNDVVRQDSNTSGMIHSIGEMVSYMSAMFTLEAGDVILTGTPAGVGPLVSGDTVVAEIEQVGRLQVSVACSR